MTTSTPHDHPSPTPAVRRLASPADPAFAALLRIYTEAIPASERKSPAQLATMLAQPRYSFLVAEDRNAEDLIVGFSIAVTLDRTAAALLEYMAVARSHRGRGIGAHLFRSTAAQPALAAHALLIEIESTRVAAPDHLARIRRQQFYRRLGARTLAGVRYRMPQLSAAPPPEMELLLHHPNPGSSIDASQVLQWIERIYAQVYSAPADPAHLRAMLPAEPRIPLD